LFEINCTEKSHKDLVISFFNIFGVISPVVVKEVIKQAVVHSALSRNIKIRDKKNERTQPFQTDSVVRVAVVDQYYF